MLKQADLVSELNKLNEVTLVNIQQASPTPLQTAVCKNGIYLCLSKDSWLILQAFQKDESLSSIADLLTREKGRLVTKAQVTDACQHIAEEIKRNETSTMRSQLSSQGYWMSTTLIPAPLVQSLSNYLRWAFNPVMFLLIIAVSAGLYSLNRGQIIVSELTPSSSISIIGLLLLSTVLHEFGHAGACAKFGLAPGRIGFTMYAIYPSLYADVNAAWQLERWQRIIISLGGVYFQLISIFLYLIAYQLFNWTPLLYVVPIISASFLFTLNPFLKFDGYWVLSDILGVPNLSQQPVRMIRSWLGYAPKNSTVIWPRAVNTALHVYTILWMLFYGFFFISIAVVLYRQAPSQISTTLSLIRTMSIGGIVDKSELFTNLLYCVFYALLSYRLLTQITRRLVRRSRI